jgi:UDP-2,3-diacylglucosamine hydrolase
MPPAPLLFIADLHLSRERPRPVDLFRRFMGEIAPTGGALYILGDFFEAWIGDDDLEDDFHSGVAAALHGLAHDGIPVFFLPGNRDFLAGEAFARAAGLTVLADPTHIDLFGTPTLLTHGDAYCTDDINYQAFRRQVRDPGWQAAFLARPLAERHALARELRERSEQAKAGKKPEIMDVNIDTVSQAFRERGVSRIIHGHTHRPARHEHRIDGRLCERWVLADWYEGVGGYLRCDADGCRALPFPAP